MTARRLSIILGVLLAFSVGVNLFFAGAFAWVVRNPAVASMVGENFQSYPRPLRQAMRADFRERRMEMAGDLRALHDARVRMVELMRAPVVDEAALRAAMADVRAATEALQARAQDNLVEVLKRVPAEVRADIRSPRAPAMLGGR